MSELFDHVPVKRDCRFARGHMSDYLDGDLASSRRSWMQQHFKECPECHRVFSMLRRMVGALHRLPPPVGSADALEIAASVRRRLGEPPPS
jgi:anti-sigma factor RsiW